MKKVEITAYGAPEEVAHCIDAPAVGDPGPGEVVFDVLAFPINPADISFCRGNYRLRPPLPATPGAEGLGRVIAVGADVMHVKPGDLVINMQRENWTQRRRVKAEDAVPIPPGLDFAQAAMLRINPPTALLLAGGSRRAETGRLGHTERRQFRGRAACDRTGQGARRAHGQRRAS
jgi:mitochondrial enoyl-[acyl-carrier protein] reductase / trans-2-enoyl-CoA reductase